MSRTVKSILGVLVVGLFIALVIWRIQTTHHEEEGEEGEARPAETTTRARVAGANMVVQLTEAEQRRSGIQVATLKQVPHQETVKGYGTVLDIQPLIEMRETYAQFHGDLRKSAAALDAARKEYRRLRDLNQHSQNVSVKSLEAALAGYRTRQADYEAAQARLAALRGKVLNQWGKTLGGWLTWGSPHFQQVLSRKVLLVQVTLPAGTPRIPFPDSAMISVQARRFVSATLVSPSPRTDPQLQGTSAFYMLTDSLNQFLAGQSLVAYLSRGAKQPGVVVPDAAVVWSQGSPMIYIQRDSTHFQRRKITVDIPVRGGWFVRNSLHAGIQIVVRGAQQLLSEEFQGQIQTGEED